MKTRMVVQPDGREVKIHLDFLAKVCLVVITASILAVAWTICDYLSEVEAQSQFATPSRVTVEGTVDVNIAELLGSRTSSAAIPVKVLGEVAVRN